MSDTLANIRSDVRARLDEATAKFWPDATLNNWINEAARDIAKRAEVLQTLDTTSIPIVAGTSKYSLPTNVIRVHRVEFIPAGAQQTYVVQPSTYQEMDQVWGTNQLTQSSYPSAFVLWGFSPNIQIQFYPVPSQAGQCNLYYYRLPATVTLDGATVECPQGWEEMLALYCEYVALRKDRDQRWQEAKTLYEQQLTNMIDVTRHLHDQAQSVIVGNNAVPSWLYSFES